MRHRLRGDTEQGLDFIHQRIYAIGLAQSLEILQDDVLAPLFRANTLLVPMKIQDGVLPLVNLFAPSLARARAAT